MAPYVEVVIHEEETMEQDSQEERKGVEELVGLDAQTSNPQDCFWVADTDEEPINDSADGGHVNDATDEELINDATDEDPISNDTDEEPARYMEEEAGDEPEAVPTEGRPTKGQLTTEEQARECFPEGEHTEVPMSEYLLWGGSHCQRVSRKMTRWWSTPLKMR